MRRKSTQYGEEQGYILVWLNAVKDAAVSDYDLACRTAQLSILARGYGNVRRNGHATLTMILKEWRHKLDTDIEKVSAEVDQTILLAHANPDSSQGYH